MKIKTNLKSGNIITTAANQAKTLTNQTIDLAKNTWNTASNQVSSLWAAATNLF